MRLLRALLFGLVILVLTADRAGSHHAFSPVYDAKRTITIDGVVTQFRFVNPHAMMLLDVKDKSGKTATWNVEFAGRLNLEEVGLDRGVDQGRRARQGHWESDVARLPAHGVCPSRPRRRHPTRAGQDATPERHRRGASPARQAANAAAVSGVPHGSRRVLRCDGRDETPLLVRVSRGDLSEAV